MCEIIWNLFLTKGQKSEALNYTLCENSYKISEVKVSVIKQSQKGTKIESIKSTQCAHYLDRENIKQSDDASGSQ